MENLQVVVESGKLQGIHGWDPRVAVFKGIPYAAPPVRELRWKAPLPAPAWPPNARAAQHARLHHRLVRGLSDDLFPGHCRFCLL